MVKMQILSISIALEFYDVQVCLCLCMFELKKKLVDDDFNEKCMYFTNLCWNILIMIITVYFMYLRVDEFH